jgi:leader peptidase (prepilin peptidase) / N-methyltransferase
MEVFGPLASSPALFISVTVVFGLLIGSFLNVVIYRVPIMMDNELRAECAALQENESTPGPTASQSPAAPAGSQTIDAVADSESSVAPAPAAAGRTEPPPFNIVTPRSACPQCKAPITALQNIPIVSWLALRGKCAHCKAPISARYPLVELATGVLSGFIAWRFGYSTLTLAALAFTWLLIALTMIDFDTQYLPDQLTYPLLWLGLLVSLAHPSWDAAADPVTPRASIIGAAAGYLSLWSVYWLFKLITGKEGMGYGDFKLFAALGAWLGWQMLLPIILFAAGVGAVFGVVIMIRQRRGRDTQMAFGPFLAVAGWLALVFGHEFVHRYFAMFSQPG